MKRLILEEKKRSRFEWGRWFFFLLQFLFQFRFRFQRPQDGFKESLKIHIKSLCIRANICIREKRAPVKFCSNGNCSFFFENLWPVFSQKNYLESICSRFFPLNFLYPYKIQLLYVFFLKLLLFYA